MFSPYVAACHGGHCVAPEVWRDICVFYDVFHEIAVKKNDDMMVFVALSSASGRNNTFAS